MAKHIHLLLTTVVVGVWYTLYGYWICISVCRLQNRILEVDATGMAMPQKKKKDKQIQYTNIYTYCNRRCTAHCEIWVDASAIKWNHSRNK